MRLVYLYLYTEINEKVNKLRNENYISRRYFERESEILINESDGNRGCKNEKKSVRVEIKKRKRKKEHKIISKYKLIKKKIGKI